LAPLVAAALLLGACGGAASAPPPSARTAATAGANQPVASAAVPPSAAGGPAGNVPTHVCDLLSNADVTAITGGTVTRMEPYVNDTFPQCVWKLQDAAKVGTAVTSLLVAFAPGTLFDHNNTDGRVDVSGVGDAAYAYPPGQGGLKSSGGELWVKTHGASVRIYVVPVDFQILSDSAKTTAWTAQSLALNEAIANQVVGKL
jgi:hypothetical protein